METKPKHNNTRSDFHGEHKIDFDSGSFYTVASCPCNWVAMMDHKAVGSISKTEEYLTKEHDFNLPTWSACIRGECICEDKER